MQRFGWRRAKPSVITLADRARDTRQWELAGGYYRDALRRKPENPPIWVQYGHVLKEAGHLREAETAYRRAIAYDQHSADSHLQLGHVLKIQDKQQEARAAYLRALALDPSLNDASFELAQLGWSNPHLSELRGIAEHSVPVSSLIPTRKSEQSFRVRTVRRPRNRASDEDIALIAPYFEGDGVLAQLGDDGFEIFDAAEYLSNPALWSYSPHYLFDPNWYAGRLAEPLDPAVNPFLHYLRVGMCEGQSPHPLFDPEFYIARWKQEQPGALVDKVFDHYLRYGSERDISPHRLFSPARYRKLYLDGADEGLNPLKHYLSQGYRTWCDPHLLFDEGWYRTRAPNLDHNTPGLVDYIVRGEKLEIDPHPLFRTRYYLDQDPNQGFERTALEAYLTGSADSDPHPLFSTTYYFKQSDGAGALTPLEHYLEEGWRQGLDPHPFFRTNWYLHLSMDIAERTTNPLLHYEKVGRRTGKGPNPFFDPLWYETRFLGGETALLPEQHYLSTGLAYDLPGRDTHPLHSGSLLRLTNIPKIPLCDVCKLPTSRPTPRIGVFLHAYYPELGKEIFGYLNNIPETCTVFLSTDTAAKAERLRRIAKRCLRHRMEIRVLPNRGRDIAPWLVGFADRMREVEIGIHLHTKKSPHWESDLHAWRRYLFDGLVGSPETVAAHLKILSHESVGASLMEHFYPLIRVGEINWGHNLELVRDLVGLCKVEIGDQTPLDFPSGSMFWFKPRALAPLLELDLRFEMFEPETGAVDGSLAHAIERSLLYIVEAAGYGWVQTTARSDLLEPACGDPLSLESFLANGGVRILPIERRPVALRRLLPVDLVPFNTTASAAKKPRLNLVVPTIDRTLGYAGLANCFELFFKLMDALGKDWDARILGTGHDPTVRFIPPEGFAFVELGEFDWSGRSTVCNATQRTWRLMDLRRDDIFLATAWQTAHITSLVCEDQSRIFHIPQRKFIYFIQDYEPPFHPWSSLYYLADATYQRPENFDAVFNTEILARFFKDHKGIEGYKYNPAFTPQIAQSVRRVKRLKNCLIYYRTHAVRNCHELCEIIVEELVNKDPQFYADWRFLAIGEGSPETVPGSRIERLGRLSLEEYGGLMSRSAVGLSLMVSPHPSYPPLEMAAAGMLVLANTYEAKDLSKLHENIVSWRSGRISDAVVQLDRLCRAFEHDEEVGWRGKSKVDWFFTPTDNLQEIARALAKQLKTTQASEGHAPSPHATAVIF
jgi:tetratricopeptide (TPR) repeat protein